MMANDGGLLKKPEHFLTKLNAACLLMESGINLSNLSDSQFASFHQQNPAAQQKSIQVYAQNLAKNMRQQRISSAGEIS